MIYLRHTITVDFSGDYERRVAGIGIVVQESTKPGRRGPIVAELAEAFEGMLSQGEKYAVLRALQVAFERGFRDLKIRSDDNAMRRRLKKSYDRKLIPPDDDLDRRILELAAEFDRVHFGYVPRRKNQRAHNLARRGRGFSPSAPRYMPDDSCADNAGALPHALRLDSDTEPLTFRERAS